MSVQSPVAARASTTPTTAPMTALMSACVVVVVAMVAAINLALPALSSSDLRPSSSELLWVVDGYILVFGCLLIPAGAIGDRFGRKGVLLGGLGVFAAGCLGAAAAPSVGLLIAARALMGVGAALVMPASLSLLLQVTPPERKPYAIATWSGATGAAGALGNLGGGLVLQWLPWQGLFLVVAPIAVALLAVVARVAPPGERHAAALDPTGAALSTAAVFTVLLGVIEGPEQGWSSAFVLGAFAASVALFVVFVGHAMRAAHPMLDPRVFVIAKLRAGTIGVGAVFFGLFALFFVNAQYLQYVKGYSPLVTGVAILPLPLGMVVVSRRSVALATRFGARLVVLGGLAMLAGGLAVFSTFDGATSYLPYAVVLTVIAAGMGLSVPSLSTGIVTALPPAKAGMGSGLNSAVREIGAAMGVAVVGTVLTSQFRGALPAGVRAAATGSVSQTLRSARQLGTTAYADAVGAFTHAMAMGFRVVAGLVAIATVVVARSMRPVASSAEVADR